MVLTVKVVFLVSIVFHVVGAAYISHRRLFGSSGLQRRVGCVVALRRMGGGCDCDDLDAGVAVSALSVAAASAVL